MRILILELLAYVSLSIAVFASQSKLAGMGIAVLFIFSGIWKTRPITLSSALLGVFVHLAALTIGWCLLLVALLITFGQITIVTAAAYFVINFLYFFANEHWSWGWRFGLMAVATGGLTLASWLSSGWGSGDVFFSHFIIILVFWRGTDLLDPWIRLNRHPSGNS